MSPTRVQISRARGWRKPEGAVYVSRGTRWGNPFLVGPDGTAEDVVRLYEAALVEGRLTFTAADVREQLAGRDLGCWCPVGSPCHADVLLAVAS